MEPQVHSLAARTLAGIHLRTNNTNEQNPATGRIHGLWQRFFSENLAETIGGRAGFLYGAYSNYATDVHGDYDHWVAMQVDADTQPPPGCALLHVPAAEYLVFPTEGAIPAAIVNGWQRIWRYFDSNCPYERTYAVDFDYYNMTEGGAQIYVGVRRR